MYVKCVTLKEWRSIFEMSNTLGKPYALVGLVRFGEGATKLVFLLYL